MSVFPSKTKDYEKKYYQEYYLENGDYLKKYQQEYYLKNKDKVSERNRIYREKNREQIREYSRENYSKNKQAKRDEMKEYFLKNPWLIALYSAKARCTNPNNAKYPRYGGRGIKFLLTKEEIKIIWFRDKAYNLSTASIDRKNNDGNYEYSNCRFIEHSLNSAKGKKLYKKLSEYNRMKLREANCKRRD